MFFFLKKNRTAVHVWKDTNWRLLQECATLLHILILRQFSHTPAKLVPGRPTCEAVHKLVLKPTSGVSAQVRRRV